MVFFSLRYCFSITIPPFLWGGGSLWLLLQFESFFDSAWPYWNSGFNGLHLVLVLPSPHYGNDPEPPLVPQEPGTSPGLQLQVLETQDLLGPCYLESHHLHAQDFGIKGNSVLNTLNSQHKVVQALDETRGWIHTLLLPRRHLRTGNRVQNHRKWRSGRSSCLGKWSRQLWTEPWMEHKWVFFWPAGGTSTEAMNSPL